MSDEEYTEQIQNNFKNNAMNGILNYRLLILGSLLLLGLSSIDLAQAQRRRSVKLDCSEAPVRISVDASDFYGINARDFMDVVLLPSDEEKVEIELSPATTGISSSGVSSIRVR